jgi:apolipoprotein D and lipocalin family protein
MNRPLLAAAIGVAIAGTLAACAVVPPVNRTTETPLRAVAQVDLGRYAGKWHEAARLPNGFERGCVAASAEYARRPDGLISVKNTCRKENGAIDSVDGRAKVVDQVSNAKLKVSFFGPFFGDYWVIDLAPDYAWSIVGEPRGRFLWILTRAPRVDAAQKAALTERVRALGYDPAKLYWNEGQAL